MNAVSKRLRCFSQSFALGQMGGKGLLPQSFRAPYGSSDRSNAELSTTLIWLKRIKEPRNGSLPGIVLVFVADSALFAQSSCLRLRRGLNCT